MLVGYGSGQEENRGQLEVFKVLSIQNFLSGEEVCLETKCCWHKPLQCGLLPREEFFLW